MRRLQSDCKPPLHVDQLPIPRVDELFANLQGGQHFSKLDMSDAYLQVELDDATKKLRRRKTASSHATTL